jgi:hypothetical protein
VVAGSRGGQLTNRHLHLYLHITSPTTAVHLHIYPISSKLAHFSLLFLPSIMRFWFYTLSRFCARGFPVWRTEKSSSPSISSHHESDRPSFVCILSQFYERGFADRCYRTMVTRVRGIHLAPRTSVLYNSTLQTPQTHNLASTYDETVCSTYLSILNRFFKVSWVHAFLGSEKFKSILSLPSIPATFRPSQCTLIMLLKVSTKHIGSKRLACKQMLAILVF